MTEIRRMYELAVKFVVRIVQLPRVHWMCGCSVGCLPTGALPALGFIQVAWTYGARCMQLI